MTSPRRSTTAEIDGDRLTDDEIIAFLFLMVVAGNETTTKLLGNALFHLSAHPEQRARGLAAAGEPLVVAVDRGDAAPRHLQPDAGALRHDRHRAPRHDRPGRRQAARAARLGQPRRAGVHRADPVRHPPRQGRAGADPQLRHRSPLLPRRQPRPAGGACRAGRAGAPRRGLPRCTPTGPYGSTRPACAGSANLPTTFTLRGADHGEEVRATPTAARRWSPGVSPASARRPRRSSPPRATRSRSARGGST